MQVNRVGKSGFEVSSLTLGTFEWGRRVEASTAQTLVDAFAEAGGILIEVPSLHSPAIDVIGSLKLPAQIAVAARVGISGRADRLHVNAGRSTILSQTKQLLSRLNADVIDLLILDAFDPDTPLDETAAALESVVQAGHAHYVAAANMRGWELAALHGAGVPVVAAFNELSLLSREAESDVLPAAQYLGVGVFAGAALGRGVLSGTYVGTMNRDSRGASDARVYVAKYLEPEYESIVAGVTKAASALSARPIDVALAWMRTLPVVSSITSPRTLAQLNEVLESRLTLEPEIREALEQISSPVR